MYRENYCQRRALELYTSGKTKADVITMLREENAIETELDRLADRFYHDYLFLQKEKRKQRRQKAEQNIMIGSVLLIGGFILTVLSYILIGTGTYILCIGALVSGIVYLGMGLIEKNDLKRDGTS
ncbi:hypothetical protein [Xanthocytophaga flava]|uniref:hypothetical protein n=1 Tax=Xanthocytophaga flava TaxID=3048013 RepID=UPI0028D00659|nr:hypothetical protein [Xanthocytophaga flavus]MDJ1466827.1 hypothetical protein [Xanthocytophaga flavus]